MTIVKEYLELVLFQCAPCGTKWRMFDDEIQNFGEMHCPNCGVKQRIAKAI